MPALQKECQITMLFLQPVVYLPVLPRRGRGSCHGRQGHQKHALYVLRDRTSGRRGLRQLWRVGRYVLLWHMQALEQRPGQAHLSLCRLRHMQGRKRHREGLLSLQGTNAADDSPRPGANIRLRNAALAWPSASRWTTGVSNGRWTAIVPFVASISTALPSPCAS